MADGNTIAEQIAASTQARNETMDEMKDWFERLKAERDELGERMGKLSAFLHSDKAHALSSEHASLLKKQWLAMLSYYAALDKRIELTEKEGVDD